MNRRLRLMGLFFSLSFFLIILNLSYLQAFAAKRILSNPANRRALAEEAQVERGRILSADGTILAESVASNGSFKRLYPLGETASCVIGFNSIKYGRSGIELAFNDFLLARSGDDTAQDFFDRLAGNDPPGNDIILSIRLPVQRVAEAALEGKVGAILAIDPRTGEVLAMATNPTFDPMLLDDSWSALIDDPSSPLLNRATQGLYPPGSSFKMLTAAAALDSGKATLSSIYPAPSELKVGGNIVSNYDKKDYSALSLKSAFALSANTVFAQVGLDLGAKDLVDYAERFGFNRGIDFELAVKESQIPKAAEMDEVELAWTAVGQAKLLVSPLQMALCASAIANDGRIMKPFLVKEILRLSGESIFRAEPKELGRPIGPLAAAAVSEMMVEAVKSGTGAAARIDGVLVAGKTGTAELAKGEPHGWFVGFAPADRPRVAVVVLLENGGQGGRVSAPLAKLVLKEALKETE